jgi:hypothetical protein
LTRILRAFQILFVRNVDGVFFKAFFIFSLEILPRIYQKKKNPNNCQSDEPKRDKISIKIVFETFKMYQEAFMKIENLFSEEIFRKLI